MQWQLGDSAAFRQDFPKSFGKQVFPFSHKSAPEWLPFVPNRLWERRGPESSRPRGERRPGAPYNETFATALTALSPDGQPI